MRKQNKERACEVGKKKLQVIEDKKILSKVEKWSMLANKIAAILYYKIKKEKKKTSSSADSRGFDSL